MGMLVCTQFAGDVSRGRVHRYMCHGKVKGQVLVRLATKSFRQALRYYRACCSGYALDHWTFLVLLRRGLRLGARRHVNNNPKWFMFYLLWGDSWAVLTGRACR